MALSVPYTSTHTLQAHWYHTRGRRDMVLMRFVRSGSDDALGMRVDSAFVGGLRVLSEFVVYA